MSSLFDDANVRELPLAEESVKHFPLILWGVPLCDVTITITQLRNEGVFLSKIIYSNSVIVELEMYFYF